MSVSCDHTMARVAALPWAALVVLMGITLSQAYYFEDGYDHHYSYSSKTDLAGTKNLTTVLKFTIRALNISGHGKRIHSLQVNSVVQFAEEEFYQDNPKGWNLTKLFLFRTSLNGSITMVHVHPEDEDELVIIKKAMTSIFHVSVRESSNATGSYEEMEQDHLGTLNHNYTVQHTKTGKTISRSHFSHETVERTHQKTLNYDGNGTLQSGETYDKIRVKSKDVRKNKSRFDMHEGKQHNNTKSRDFPVISTFSKAHFKLDSKRLHGAWNHSGAPSGLKDDTLQINLKVETRRLREVSKNISAYIQCVHDYPEKGDANRTDCVHSLRKILMSLQKDDYAEFGRSVLNKTCTDTKSRCYVERMVFIDIIARIADDMSQRMIVDHVLNTYNPDEEELRHVFIHCIAVEKPLLKLLQAVENYCFGASDQHHGSINLTTTQRRACLAVGSLARNLHLNSNSSEAFRLVNKLETWITKHANHTRYRQKRYLDSQKDHHYITSKVMLIYSLGNAGHPQFLDRIISLTSPYQGHHEWRRAAVDALRHYKCNKSVNALLNSAIRDSKQSVRDAARYLYLKHPRAASFTKEQERTLLSYEYTWPLVARLRRSFFDTVLFKFNLALPRLDWKKEIGTEEVGASFGVKFENYLQGVFRPLSSFVAVNIDDKVWAEVHIKPINKEFDIFRIEACYKGRLEYNMNKFKDYSYGLMENLIGVFDDMAQDIMKPMTDAANKVSSQFRTSDGKKTKSNFEPLAKAVKEIPLKTGEALKATINLSKLGQKYKNLPWVTRLQQVANQAQSLMEGVNTEALNFYKKVSSTAVIALPYGEKEIMESMNKALKVMDKISKHPKQAFSELETSRLKTKNSQNLMKNLIGYQRSNVARFISAQSPSWMSRAQDIGNMVSSLGSFRSFLSKRRKRRRRSASPFDQVSDIHETAGESSTDIANTINAQIDKVTKWMENVRDKAPVALQEGLEKQKIATEMLQDSFKTFQEKIEIVKSTIQAIFGAKFHPSFPSQIRPSDSGCGKGTYPADTRDKYETAGIDLVLQKGWKVYCPVAGLVKTSGSNVVIEPTDADFKQYEIIIGNMNPSVGSKAKHYGQGAIIGTSKGENGCDWSHIHLAIKKKTRAGGDDLCFYIDPSPFVNSLKLKPVWHQECKSFLFKHIGQIFDSKNFAESLKKLVKKFARRAIDWVKNLGVKMLEKITPPNSIFGKIAGVFTGNNLGKSGSVSDVTDLFDNVGGKMKNFFSDIDIMKTGYGELSRLLKSDDMFRGILPKLDGLLGTATSMLSKPPLDNLKSLAFGGIGKLLASQGFPKLGGKLTSTVQLKLSMFKVCPHFKHGFQYGMDQFCTADKDCLGFTCHINIPFSFMKEGIKFKVRPVPLQEKVDVSVKGEGHSIPKGTSVAKTGVQFGPVSLSLKSSTQWQGDSVIMSLSLSPCFSTFCLVDIKVIKNLKIHTRHKRGAFSFVEGVVPNLKAMDMSGIIDQLANLNVPGGEFVQQMNGMMDGVLSKISGGLKESVGNFVKELPDDEDEYEDKHKFKMGSVYAPFFPAIPFVYPLGPILLSIKCGAGAEIGSDLAVDVQAVKSTTATTISPYIAAKVEISFAISVLIAEIGIKLTGWLMKTSFPYTLEVNYSKLPTVETKNVFVELTPLKLRLELYVEFFRVYKASKIIWEWESESIKTVIWESTKNITNNKAPRFPSCDSRKRSISGSCSILQITGRHPRDTAFLLEVESKDDSSTLTIHYSIGTARGGRDVRSLVEIRGSSLTVPTASLPNGVPLYWTLRARNTQGKESTTSCMLPTFDNTLPDGRVDAAYPFTSHRTTIQANLVVFEDSKLRPNHKVAVGYSPGEFGKEVLDWKRLILRKTKARTGDRSALKYFSPSIKGKLSSRPLTSKTARNDVECAMQCKRRGSHCVSFDFEMHSRTCDLQETVRGPNAKLVTSGSYYHYERLGVGYSAFLQYKNLNLEHGAQYFVNAKVTNILYYTAYLPSIGTLVDFTPPEPGPVGYVVSDIMVADGCRAAVTQRCVDVNSELNHRKIIDGPGGRTIFNGHRPLEDEKATLSNNFISGNCDGFHDDESGIRGYTWAVGTSLCGSDIVSFRDPHAQLQTRDDWTFTGLAKDLHLPDGPYYITFQAINNVVHGGALVTTVCHSQPFTVDTTPPLVHEVGDLLFDEDFDILGVYFNVSDDESGIARVDFALGRTKYDVFVRSYSHHHFMTRDDPYLVIEDLGLTPGVLAWVRIRAVNSVSLFTAGHGEIPILIDFTPPVIGRVLDGRRVHQDIDYQHDTSTICAQWIKFYDPESGIDHYYWGVGTLVGHDDVVALHNYTHRVKWSCNETVLQHNTTYYSMVIAFNAALNQKEVLSFSNGVLVDITPPIKGYVQDGRTLLRDIDFSSETATIESCWDNFTDPESHVPKYEVSVYVNDELKKVFGVGSNTHITDHTLAMKHLDQVRVDVTATNGAELTASAGSDGYLVDETPPNMIYLTDSKSGRFQNDASHLTMNWYFIDSESGVSSYRYTIFQKLGGQKQKFWPINEQYAVSKSRKTDIILESLSLSNGAVYTVSVTALNRALLATIVESSGVTIDNTSPTLKQIQISLPGEEEYIDEQGNVMHIEGEPLHVSWTARDPESGIVHSLLCITDVLVQCTEDEQFVDYGTDTSVTLAASTLVASTEVKYVVTIRVVNGAEMKSEEISKPILVQKGNSPGTVYDGRYYGQDTNYQQDMSSLSMSFTGFESQGCGVTGYDWGIGKGPYSTDIMRFTNYGLTMLNDSSGFAEISNTNFLNVKYYVTVRAITGEKCHEPYIVSSSDGITIDREIPVIIQKYKDAEITKDIIFESQTLNVPISWFVNDTNGIATLSWSISNYPGLGENHLADIFKTELGPGEVNVVENRTYFVNTMVTDFAGNKALVTSPPITIDKSPAFVQNFSCTPYVSKRMTSVQCSWQFIKENESKVGNITVRAGPTLQHLEIIARLSAEERTLLFDMEHSMKQSTNSSVLYLIIDLENEAQLHNKLYRTVVIDYTGPSKGTVKVVTLNNTAIQEPAVCQTQTTHLYVMLQEFKDQETGIDRYELGIGSQEGLTDILNFTKVRVVNGLATLRDLQLFDSSLVYITARVFNKAGLYTVQSGGAVAISLEPYITVVDGPASDDIDSQHDLSVIQGRWSFSDPCPVKSAEWAVMDITGEIAKDFEHTPGNGKMFYNDELALKNMKTYIVTVRIVDKLNRTITGRSDGVMVQIQPPFPGHVRDGLGKDINYQLPTDYLTANWDPFGDADASEPSQQITYYEVAIGDDRRYDKTRSNVHFYENVGLNTSHVFLHLNLTAKTKVYFITVKAYSAAGSFDVSFSNGIQVGYGDEVLPGEISVNSYQSSTSKISVMWSDFVSDFEIRNYEVALHSDIYEFDNQTVECSDIKISSLVPFTSVGKDTIASLKNLKLNHSEVYFVIVKAEDEAGMCLMASSGAITVDTTPPSAGKVSIQGGRSGGLMYVKEINALHIMLTGFVDEESPVDHYTVQLLGGSFCSGYRRSTNFSQNDILMSVDVSDSEAHFNDIRLDRERAYYVNVKVFNKAKLSTTVMSAPIMVDLSTPVPGNVKIGSDWKHNFKYWSKLNELEGTVNVYSQPSHFQCEWQKEVLTDLNKDMKRDLIIVRKPFDAEAVQFRQSNHVDIYARLDPSLNFFQKGGILTQQRQLSEGGYSFTVQATSGHEVSALIGLTQSDFPVPDDIIESASNQIVENCSESACEESQRNLESAKWNVGLLFTMNENSSEPVLVFWAKDSHQLKAQIVKTDFDPRISLNKYTFRVYNASTRSMDSWNVDLLINEELIAQYGGLSIAGDVSACVFTWNNNGYVPPVDDPFHPFSTSMVVSAMKIPEEQNSTCHFGKTFFDSESGIRDIFVGLSNTPNETANLLPYRKHQTFCVPCNTECVQNCNFTNVCDVDDDTHLSIQHLTLENLTLTPSHVTDVINYTDVEISAYYLDIKVIDHAGYSIEVKSDAVIIDTTPPFINSVTCYDPDYSMFVSVRYVGNNHSVAVSWDISEDFSDITEVFVGLGRKCGDEYLLSPTFQAKSTKAVIELTDAALEQDHVYYVSVTASNSAGLKDTSCCNFTTDFRNPVTPQTKPKALFTSSETVPGLDVGITEYNDRVGIQWENPVSDVEFFNWELSSEGSQSSIYPSMVVGDSSVRSVEVVGGNIVIGNGSLKVTLSEFMNRNFTNGMKNSDFSNEPLSLEPGKCVSQIITCVSRSHRKTKMSPQINCNKRRNDHIMIPGNMTTLTFKGSRLLMATDVIDVEAGTMTVKISKGGLIVGVLSPGELDKSYGAPGAAEYAPYIVKPDITSTQLSRSLFGRIIRIVGDPFYMSPVTNVYLEENIRITLENTSYSAPKTDQEHCVIFWDSQFMVWRHIQEVCENSTLGEIEICNMVFARDMSEEDNRSNEETAVYPNPRMFSVAIVQSSITNTQPFIRTDIIFCMEDTDTMHRIDYHDPEGDSLTFAVETPPQHGSAYITSNGELWYSPEANYDGIDSIVLSAVEHFNHDIDIKPHTLTKQLYLNVSSVNDPPVSFFQKSTDEIVSSSDKQIFTMYLEGNLTEHVLGVFWMADVDQSETLHLLIEDSVDVSANFSLTNGSLDHFNETYLNLTQVYQRDTISNHVLSLKTSTDYHGNRNISILVQDNAYSYSHRLTVAVFILISPCYHGSCVPTTSDLPCLHPTRAFAFNLYRCDCKAGYEGELCQHDTNECLQATCSLLYDCEDRLAEYECILNVPKVIAIIIFMLLLPVAAFFILHKCRSMRGHMSIMKPLDKPSTSHTNPVHRYRTIFDASADEGDTRDRDHVDETVTKGFGEEVQALKAGIFKKGKKTWNLRKTTATNASSSIQLLSLRTFSDDAVEELETSFNDEMHENEDGTSGTDALEELDAETKPIPCGSDSEAIEGQVARTSDVMKEIQDTNESDTDSASFYCT